MSQFPSDISREEFCELVVVLYEKMSGEKAVVIAQNPFTDTKNLEVLKAYNLGIVAGKGEGKFAPDDKVTRQELAAMLVRALKVIQQRNRLFYL